MDNLREAIKHFCIDNTTHPTIRWLDRTRGKPYKRLSVDLTVDADFFIRSRENGPAMVSSLSKETARITELIKQEQLGEIETVWTEALEKAPTEIGTFLALAEKLAKASHGEKAGQLLEQVVRKLDETSEHRKAATVLGELARVAPRNTSQRELADTVFGNAFGDLAGFEKCKERAEEAAGGSDNKYVRDLWSQLMFQPGDWVFHDAGWGLGEVKEIDAENGELKIDFSSKEDHKVKLGAAAKFFRKLPEEDIMVQRAAHLDELKARCKEDPVAVVLNILRGHNNKSTLKRIKAELVPAVIESKNWAKWWTGTRKELAQHQYVKLGVGTNPTIDRLVTAMTHEDETRERFDNAVRLHQKLELVRRYLRDSSKSPERAELLQYIANELKEDVNRDEPLDEKQHGNSFTLAGERIVVACLIDDLKRAQKEVEVELGYDVNELVKDSEALVNRLEEIGDSEYQQRALDLHSELNESAWPKTFREAMLKDVASLWDHIAKKLLESEQHKELRKSLDTIAADGEKYPLQTLWLSRRGILGTQLADGFEIAPANELFSKLLWTINKVLTRIERGETALKDTLASLRSAMTERNSRLLNTALDGLNEERAAHLMHEIERCRGLSDIHQSTLRDIVMKAFPALQARAALQAAEMGEEAGGEILATNRGLRKRQGELKRIQEDELPDVAKQIGEALAMGDVSENAELDAARERESRLKEAAKEIMEELKRVRVVDPTEVDAAVAGFGTKVSLKREDGKSKVYTILGRYEADHENFIISNESPIAQGILGKKPGEKATVETPEGAVHYDVISVERAE
ncbi:MAG: GreA/GreB family elongation factor [Planctomycetes bacterium]|nr:GreA/GreB family elongation factor [Planctomycetota bacterium]